MTAAKNKNRLVPDPEEELRANQLEAMLKGLPEEAEDEFETLSAFEQDFLSSARRQFDIWQDLSVGQEETLLGIWQQWQEKVRRKFSETAED